MQQQATPQEQYGHINQQQMAQQIMMCPIQYVYESPMLMPQPQEEPIQQNQNVLFSVQNPPPWIHTPPQNQIVYIQQVPNNYQQYHQQNMIQNPIYQPQFNYQIQQHMMAQDGRQYIQIPNVIPNTVQNQPAQIAQVNKEEPNDKMPLLTHMLTQKPNFINNVPNNIRAQANFRPPPPVNVIRPITQNQQVQTEITANNKGRPRNSQPQVITINPIQHRPYLQQKPEVLVNIARPPFIRSEIPQHIQNKIPSSISVKTIYRPIQPRPIRPFDVIPVQRNFFYNPSFIATPNNREIRNNMVSNVKQIDNQENPGSANVEMRNNPVNNMTLIGNVQSNPVSAEAINAIRKLVNANVGTNTEMRNNLGNTMKQSSNVQSNAGSISNATSKFVDATVSTDLKNHLVKSSNVNNDKINTGTNAELNIETDKDKLIRNTVYVQARGRVTNEIELQQNNNLKRTMDDRLKNETVTNSAKNGEDANNSNKVKKFADSASQTKSFLDSALRKNFNTQQPKITNIPTQPDVIKIPTTITHQPYKTIETINDNHKREELKLVQDASKASEQVIETNTNNISNFIKEKTAADKAEDIKIKEHDKAIDSENTDVLIEKINKKYSSKKNDEQIVLTHVLDGYVIQESNVAFPIYTTTAESKHSQDTINTQNEIETKTTCETKDVNEDKIINSNHSPWKCSNDSINTKIKMEIAEINKDDPFENIKKTTVASWTTEQLVAHLVKYEWRDTAAKLQDEEIDGESLLLVNKAQLVTIGICDQHAHAIATFIESR